MRWCAMSGLSRKRFSASVYRAMQQISSFRKFAYKPQKSTTLAFSITYLVTVRNSMAERCFSCPSKTQSRMGWVTHKKEMKTLLQATPGPSNFKFPCIVVKMMPAPRLLFRLLLLLFVVTVLFSRLHRAVLFLLSTGNGRSDKRHS